MDMLPFEILDQRQSGAHFFDQKGIVVYVGSPSLVVFNDLALELGIFKTVAEDVEQISAFAADVNDRARGIARKLLRAERRIPAHG